MGEARGFPRRGFCRSRKDFLSGQLEPRVSVLFPILLI